MKCVIDSQVVLLRAPEGPLAAYVKPFAGLLREQGYARDSIQRQVMLTACFSRWLNYQGVPLRNITSEHPPRYLRYRARRARPSHGDAAALTHLLTFLSRGLHSQRGTAASTQSDRTMDAGVRGLSTRCAWPGWSNDR